MSPAEREQAAERHARHYAVVLRSANELYLAGGDKVMAGLGLFDLERGFGDTIFNYTPMRPQFPHPGRRQAATRFACQSARAA